VVAAGGLDGGVADVVELVVLGDERHQQTAAATAPAG